MKVKVIMIVIIIVIIIVIVYKDSKDLNYKLFKAKAAYISNDLDEHLFERIFGCKFVKLVGN